MVSAIHQVMLSSQIQIWELVYLKIRGSLLRMPTNRCAFGIGLKSQLFLLFSLFLLLFMNPIVLFDIIHRFYCTISLNKLLLNRWIRPFFFKEISCRKDPKSAHSQCNRVSIGLSRAKLRYISIYQSFFHRMTRKGRASLQKTTIFG